MLALIAGQGALPEHLDAVLRARGEGYHLRELEGFPTAPDLSGAQSREAFRIERLGSLIAELQALGVTTLCFAGSIQRPPLDPTALDPATMPLVPRMMAALQAGDDAALRAVIGFFEEAGIAVVGAAEIAPDLLPAPTAAVASAERDAARGAEIVAAMGRIDVGQACVVHKGQALAIEAMPGTDAMLSALAGQRDGVRGGILFKAPKPDQDRRIDLPAIGPQTVMRAAEAGLVGIVIEAGGVMVLDADEVAAELTRSGLFLWVRAPETTA